MSNYGYNKIHDEVRAEKGLATMYLCVDCPNRAANWSYDNNDPNEHFNLKLQYYSENVDHYVPRCMPCHQQFDMSKKFQERITLQCEHELHVKYDTEVKYKFIFCYGCMFYRREPLGVFYDKQ